MGGSGDPLLLGQPTAYPDRYAPELLTPLSRQALQTGGGRRFGEDIWNAWELSWLDRHGLPQVGVGEFRIPADSPCLIESKSFKLYLNSLNQERFADVETVMARLREDLGRAAGATVDVALHGLSGIPAMARVQAVTDYADVLLGGGGAPLVDIDSVPLRAELREPTPALLAVRDGETVRETLCSNLLKSNCPVTGQPDWATLFVAYEGRPIDREGLLAYVVSFRHHQDFHEHCVERIHADLLACCQPQRLTVYARYTRRGGLDINPWRSSEAIAVPNWRLSRQ